MKEIKTVGIIGLGALGVLYAQQFTKALGRDQVLILADSARIERYRNEGMWYNGELCNFQYIDADTVTEPVDLLLFAVKFGGLESSIETCRHLTGPNTTIINVLNGILCEEILGQAFSPEQVIWCVAQKMSALKQGNRVTVNPTGELAIGVPAGASEEHLRRLIRFFDEIRFPYHLPEDILCHMWGKLICNVGCNQAAMVYQCGYGLLKVDGPARETMLGAMREVVKVGNAEGIPLTESDVLNWVSITDGFPDDGEPSMRQDSKAHRKSEVALFAGTIRRLAQKHGISVPVNDWLYEKVQEMESSY